MKVTFMKAYIWTLAALYILSATTPASAQTEQDTAMNRTMRLERDFSPIVQQKNKIDQQPATQPVQTKKNNATMADWKVSSVKSAEIGVMPVGQVIASPEQEQDGYLEFSAGNYWNTHLKAGIILDEFRVDAAGFFTKGKQKLPFDVYHPAQDSLSSAKFEERTLTGNIQASYCHDTGDEATVEAHFGAQGSSVNTFHYDFFNFSTDTLIQVGDKAGKQSWGKIFGDISYETDQFKVGAYYDFSKLTSPDTISGKQLSNTLLLNAKYGWYDQDTWQASMDVTLGGVFGKQKSYFILHPNLHLSLIPDPSAWRRFYADLGFGTRREGLSELMEHVPYAQFDKEYKSTFDAMDLHIGFEDNNSGYLRWGAEVQLAFLKNALCAQAVSVDTTRRDGLYMNIFQDDDFRFGLKGNIDYEYNRYFGTKIDLTLLTHSCEAASFGDPAFQIDWHVLSHPGKLTLDANLDMGFGCKTWYNEKEYDLGPAININFRGDYQCSDELSLFAGIHNEFGKNAELFPAIPYQTFNIYAGFHWDF
jgi:hypothetical protein